jgi:putative FmdB family regulatory protein
MPLFEYRCRDCGRHFEAFVTGARPAVCPDCSGRDLEKQLSVFAVSTSSASASSMPAVGPCGACGDPRGPGACRLQ